MDIQKFEEVEDDGFSGGNWKPIQPQNDGGGSGDGAHFFIQGIKMNDGGFDADGPDPF